MKPSWDDAPAWAQYLTYVPDIHGGYGDWEWHEQRPQREKRDSVFRSYEWKSSGKTLKALPRSDVFHEPEPRP